MVLLGRTTPGDFSPVTPTCEILVGDAREKLATLPAESVHCCVTSPPYDRLRTYGNGSDGAEWDFEGTAAELFRVLVQGGVCCWNVGDSVVNRSETLTSFRQAIYFVDQVGFLMHDTMIWHKPNFANPETARYHQLFEYVFVLTKGKSRVFNPIKDKPNATAGRIGCLGVNTYSKRDGTKSTRPKYVTREFGMRGNVWRGPTRGQEEFCSNLPHPAMMPKWLARDLIRSWSNPGDVILDPFAGSGTTLQMALENGRSAIGIELNPAYAEICRERTRITPGMML